MPDNWPSHERHGWILKSTGEGRCNGMVTTPCNVSMEHRMSHAGLKQISLHRCMPPCVRLLGLSSQQKDGRWPIHDGKASIVPIQGLRIPVPSFFSSFLALHLASLAFRLPRPCLPSNMHVHHVHNCTLVVGIPPRLPVLPRGVDIPSFHRVSVGDRGSPFRP